MLRVFTKYGVLCGYSYDADEVVLIDPYYNVWGEEESWLAIGDTMQQHNQYTNSTTGIAEKIGVQVDNWDDLYTGCLDQTQYFDDLSTFNETQQIWITSSAGCRTCNSTHYVPVVNDDAESGIAFSSCYFIGNQTGEENDLCAQGAILVWTGLIEDQQELICTSCTTLIPNCLACKNK